MIVHTVREIPQVSWSNKRCSRCCCVLPMHRQVSIPRGTAKLHKQAGTLSSNGKQVTNLIANRSWFKMVKTQPYTRWSLLYLDFYPVTCGKTEKNNLCGFTYWDILYRAPPQEWWVSFHWFSRTSASWWQPSGPAMGGYPGWSTLACSQVILSHHDGFALREEREHIPMFCILLHVCSSKQPSYVHVHCILKKVFKAMRIWW